MDKLPEWMKHPASRVVADFSQPYRDAAKVILRDAQEAHAEGHREASLIGRKIAAALNSVANGATLKDAFQLSD